MFDINDAIFFSNNVSNVNFDGLNNTQSTNSFLDNITTGGLLSGLNDIGLNPNDLNSSDIIDVGLNTLTSLIPGFSIVNNLVGGDIGQNISNVISYGLNSWGATTSPENIGQYLNAFQDDINQLVNNFDKDPNTYFNELGKFLWWGTQFYGRMRRDHANANSTKEAYDMAINFFDKNQKEIWWKIY
ncbi:MAG TPA: hypothetical protein EYO76_03520, partial [Flavobacteriaceae bacterium]|nr:hypothetical protein [Flavobacteriaceae bacterium]